VKNIFHAFKPKGITFVAIISQSHVAIHTYPEFAHVSLDIFTCSRTQIAHLKLIKYFKRKFDAQTVNCIAVERGPKITFRKGPRPNRIFRKTASMFFKKAL